jgi:hypothetical protein
MGFGSKTMEIPYGGIYAAAIRLSGDMGHADVTITIQFNSAEVGKVFVGRLQLRGSHESLRNVLREYLPLDFGDCRLPQSGGFLEPRTTEERVFNEPVFVLDIGETLKLSLYVD